MQGCEGGSGFKINTDLIKFSVMKALMSEIKGRKKRKLGIVKGSEVGKGGGERFDISESGGDERFLLKKKVSSAPFPLVQLDK